MKAKPVSSSMSANLCTVMAKLTPKASNISALPELLVILLFPCFATKHPQAARTIDTVVETLKLLLLSPPVPQLSISFSFKW